MLVNWRSSKGSPTPPDNKRTKDHVPPKGFFAEPYPPNLLSVYSCRKCNGGKSNDEEILRLLLTVGVDQDSEAARVYEEKALWGTVHGRHHVRRIAEIFSNAKKTELWRNGTFQTVYKAGVPLELVNAVCSNIVRGVIACYNPLLETHELQVSAYLVSEITHLEVLLTLQDIKKSKCQRANQPFPPCTLH